MSAPFRFLLIWALVALLKFLLNGFHYLSLSGIKAAYLEFTASPNQTRMIHLYESKQRALSLLALAGVSSKKIPIHQIVGSYDCTGLISVFDEYPSTSEPFCSYSLNAFVEAIGTFKQRMIDSVNPFYWLGLVVYAPLRFLGLCGLSPDNTAVKILQALYWLLSAAAAFLMFFEKNTLAQWAAVITDYLAH